MCCCCGLVQYSDSDDVQLQLMSRAWHEDTWTVFSLHVSQALSLPLQQVGGCCTGAVLPGGTHVWLQPAPKAHSSPPIDGSILTFVTGSAAPGPPCGQEPGRMQQLRIAGGSPPYKPLRRRYL
jgi:hypothetical protein